MAEITKAGSPEIKGDFIKTVKSDYLLLFFFSVLVILTIAFPSSLRHYHELVEWKTIAALTGLLMLVTGIKESGYLYNAALKILGKIKSERSLALFLIMMSAVLSMFLTNDIALFIVVPLTLSLQGLLKNNIKKIVVFEAIGVNVGSTLTPIGNPQNLFLWHESQVSFLSFMYEMMPLELVLLGGLALFTLLIFKNRTLSPGIAENPGVVDKKLLRISTLLFLVFLVFFNLHVPEYGLIPVALVYLFFFRDILKKVDWLLLVVFILMFIDLRLIAGVPAVTGFFTSTGIGQPENLFLTSIVTSQFISNVPAAILLAEYSQDWSTIAYGVNVGGNGIIIGSLANIIALRMVKDKKIWVTFHIYSIVFLLVTGAAIYGILFWI